MLTESSQTDVTVMAMSSSAVLQAHCTSRDKTVAGKICASPGSGWDFREGEAIPFHCVRIRVGFGEGEQNIYDLNAVSNSVCFYDWVDVTPSDVLAATYRTLVIMHL